MLAPLLESGNDVYLVSNSRPLSGSEPRLILEDEPALGPDHLTCLSLLPPTLMSQTDEMAQYSWSKCVRQPGALTSSADRASVDS
ncbi:hypothetical protein J6590_091722 [Homalodisca vitripennis]|nr:hypothetical protein J6590_091722 [Homalodisca vitripennis]